jgi:adenylosuccinate lyase
VALAEVQAEFGLLTMEQVEDLRRHSDDVDITRSLQIETEIHHDLMSELKAFAEQCPMGGGMLHLGATSMDIEDNADALRLRQSLDLVISRLHQLLLVLVEKVELQAEMPLMAYTHLQPAEPSTLGYRLATYAQDLLSDWENLRRVRAHLRGKGFKGAVGTGAAYADLVGVENLARFEMRLSVALGLPFYPVTTQTYPRKQDYELLCALAGLGATLYKFAFDLRILQSPPIGEWSEPFAQKQVGSSAMPFKRNPIHAEKIDSLARSLAQMPRIAWDNAAHSLLERTLDDSANRRSLLPEAFLIAEELLLVANNILSGLQVNEATVQRNLQAYAPFAATERVLMALSRAGADRQVMHERLRSLSLTAWSSVQVGGSNPLLESICCDEQFLTWLPEATLRDLMVVDQHIGDAPQRARQLAETIRHVLGELI